jgi:hypothetical protein
MTKRYWREVRLRFRDLYDAIEGSADPSAALEGLLGELPALKKEF